MAHIEHVALWTEHLEEMRRFYEVYFGASAGAKYVNAAKRFESYFLTFPSGARLELMRTAGVEGSSPKELRAGYAHVAFSTGSERAVDELTSLLREDGFQIVDGPRRTGDGYYESCVLDPDGNRVEITV